MKFDFDAEAVRTPVRTFCPCCHKRLARTLSKTFYRNPFHNWEVTRQKIRAEQAATRLDMEVNGVVCAKCLANGAVRRTYPPKPYIPRLSKPSPRAWPKVYLSHSINTVWLADFPMTPKNLVCPTTGEYLLQIPTSTPEELATRFTVRSFPCDLGMTDCMARYEEHKAARANAITDWESATRDARLAPPATPTQGGSE